MGPAPLKAIGTFVVAAMLTVACSGSEDDAEGAPCPAGTIRRTSTNELEGPGAATREEAVQDELANLDMESSDQAIAAGVIASSPGSSPGSEEIQVPLREGLPVTMTLIPLDPGWAVEGSTWCAPDEE
jgi:hypothetical protein